MEPPLISVVIASYNYAHYITTAIESVLSQDDPNLELIVVDNRSTDESWEIINRYAAADPRLRAYQNETNLGITGNHNSGLAKAGGMYVMFLSADDFFLPGHLKALRAIRTEHPDCDVAYTTAYLCDESGVPYAQRLIIGEPQVDTAAPRNEFAHLLESCFMCLPTMLIPKRYFDELGPFDESIRIAFDWEMSIRMARAGARFATRRIPTVGVRFHGPQASGYANYFASGADFRETLDLYEKYITVENVALLRVQSKSIATGFRSKIAVFDEEVGAEKFPVEDRRRVSRALDELALIETADLFVGGANPRVAVIVPSCGRFMMLYDALQSIVRQTYPNWHAYVIRDRGFDHRSLLAMIPGLAGRVSFIDTRSRRGPGGARDFAMLHSQGDLTAYLDEDNTWQPEHLELAVSALRSSGKRAVFTRARLAIDEVQSGRRQTIAQNVDLFRASLEQQQQIVGNSLPLNAVVHDRLAYTYSGPFNWKFELLEDWEFLLRLEAYCGFAMVPEITVDVHAHVGLQDQYLLERIAAYPEYLDRLYNAARVSDTTLLGCRGEQRELAARLVERVPELMKTPQGIFDIYSVLTGALAMRNAVV